ncbi:hypothetical protein O0L34_g9925 [Tuta absoluta]|nr:hypothetical protein O0L34_g9925 [Tuta absoluta]
MTTRRTPPPAAPSNLMHVLSDPNMSLTSMDNINIGTRFKRARNDSSPSSSPNASNSDATQQQQQKSNDDIKQMLTDWKISQDLFLEKLTLDANAQKSSIKRLVADIAEVKQQNQTIQQTNNDIQTSLKFINDQYEDMKKQVQALHKESQQKTDYIISLEKKINDIQQNTRTSSVEIRNIPYKDNEKTTDLLKVVANVASAVDVQLSPTNIRDVYRLPGKPGTTKPIVAEFSTVQTKQNLLSATRKFNKNRNATDKLNTEAVGIPGPKNPIYVAEYLPGSTRKLFYLTKEFAKLNNYKFYWASNGNVFLRKNEGDRQILVKSEKMLLELQNSQ